MKNRQKLPGSFVKMSIVGGVAVCCVATAQAVTLTSTIDYTTSNVIVVDDDSAISTLALSNPVPTDVITGLSVTVNVTGSSGSINADGTSTESGLGANGYWNELSLVLTSAEGTSLTLIATGTYDQGVDTEFVVFNFEQGGASQSGTVASGSFAPTGGSFAAFNGEDASGFWTLTIADSVGGDPKSLNSWTLNVETGAAVVAAIPEPSSALLSMLGIGVLGLRRKRS
ncbi:proprotein convertase P-domain-containing protein [Rubritalea sp.]|uniref:proprotein convertase P-domain-containing protein n=1 Tax=Rubritalea sp. TaxID=2109375 RepID=UPI003EF4D6FF